MDTLTRNLGLSYSIRPDYIHARITARHVDRSTAMTYLSEVISKCADRRCHRLLLERDIPTMMSDDELFQTMDEVVAMDSGTRIAFLNPHTTIEEGLQHIELYGAGPDGNYRCFRTREEAEQWLLEEEA